MDMSQNKGLSRQYIQVRRNKNGEITYGGDQNFFAGAPADSADARKQRMGCGVTAFGDLLLYLGGGFQGYCTGESENYINRVLSEDEYKSYYNLIYDFLGRISAGTNVGLSCIRLWGRFNRLSRRERWRLRARWGLSCGKLYGRIVEMLDKDIPVILCIPVLFGKKNKGRGIAFYQKEKGVYRQACTVSAHYVVITELVQEEGRTYLGISSWGRKYYVDWQEYERLIRTHFLGFILGNILYIK